MGPRAAFGGGEPPIASVHLEKSKTGKEQGLLDSGSQNRHPGSTGSRVTEKVSHLCGERKGVL